MPLRTRGGHCAILLRLRWLPTTAMPALPSPGRDVPEHDAHDGRVGEGHLHGILDGVEEQRGLGGGKIGHCHVEIGGEGHVHTAIALAGRAGGA